MKGPRPLSSPGHKSVTYIHIWGLTSGWTCSHDSRLGGPLGLALTTRRPGLTGPAVRSARKTCSLAPSPLGLLVNYICNLLVTAKTSTPDCRSPNADALGKQGNHGGAVARDTGYRGPKAGNLVKVACKVTSTLAAGPDLRPA